MVTGSLSSVILFKDSAHVQPETKHSKGVAVLYTEGGSCLFKETFDFRCWTYENLIKGKVY